jgi:hypothetical protein
MATEKNISTLSFENLKDAVALNMQDAKGRICSLLVSQHRYRHLPHEISLFQKTTR